MEKICIIIPSRNRSETLEKNTLSFVRTLGIDYLVGVEKSQEYDCENLIRFDKDNIGLCKSLDTLVDKAKENGATLIWKMDDDIKCFTNDIKNSISIIIDAFERNKKLGGISFPYSHEFYYPENVLFSHKNARTQTSYIVRADLIDYKFELGQFEDFYQFINLRARGYYTLLCSKHKIQCMSVGKPKGGYQDFNRKIMAFDAIKKLQNKYPQLNIGIRVKEDKNWYYEPILNHKLFKKEKLR